VRLTTFPVLADGFHRRHGPRAPSRGPLSFRRRIGRRAPTRLRLEHLLVTDSVRGSLESAPTRRTSRRHDRRFASREGHERCDRIEMLSIVHHSFARVRITPRHARVEPGRPSSCYGGRWLYRVLGAFVTIRSGPCSGLRRLPCWVGGSPLTREGGDRRRPFDGWRRRVARRWGPSRALRLSVVSVTRRSVGDDFYDRTLSRVLDLGCRGLGIKMTLLCF
jgi:hypothetical protein